MSYNAVIFDLDGTLVNTLGSIKHAVNLAMRKCGYPEHDLDAVKSFINFGSVELVRRALPEEVRTEQEIMRVHDIYFPILQEHSAYECHAYEGIRELCMKLVRHGVKIAVLTNKPDGSAKNCVNECLGDVPFLTIRGMVPGKYVKPNRDFTDDVMREIQATADETIFVGDSIVDVKTAHNALLKCVGVCWGFHGDKGFLDETPDFLVHNTKELEELILGKGE